VSVSDVAAWNGSGRPQEIFHSIIGSEASIAPARRRLRSRPRRVLAIAFALVALTAGTAAARALLFGEPAPEKVKRDIRGVDAGYPADLRLDPDVEQARSVASTGSSTLYYASLKDGGYCTELVTAGKANGAVCTPGREFGTLPIEASVPFTDPVTDASPVTVAGRVNAAGATSLQILYADGSTDAIPFGDDRFFVFDVPSEHLAATHEGDFTLTATDPAGHTVATALVPAVRQDDVEAQDRQQPIFVSTISEGSDLTKVLGVEGSVNVRGAASLELRYPDGTTTEIPLNPDGTYRLDLPAERQDDLFERPGVLTVRDADGHVLAKAYVAAVAYQRAHAP
jgi:hypothetical protein